MSSDLYALIALAARYWFVALILVLLFRGWRMTVADNRRAKLLREWMGQTGCVGELIANPGAKKRVSYPIPREGVLGCGRNADVRIKHRDLKRAHAHFELREGGLLMKPIGNAQLSVGGGYTGEAVFLQDGDVLTVGRLKLMLVLFEASAEEEQEEDEWFEVGPDAGPAGEGAEEEYDEFPAADRDQPFSFDEDAQYPERGKSRQKFVAAVAGFDERPAKPRARSVSADADSRDTKRLIKMRTGTGSADTKTRHPGTAAARNSGSASDGAGRRHASKSEIPGAARTRAKPSAHDDFFDEDKLWQDR